MDIRPATPSDVSAILSLMRDFAEFEKLLEFFEIAEDKLSEVLFGKNSFAHCLVALDNDKLAGYAIFYPNFATFRGHVGMYLEDLYISSDYRGRGIGERMLRTIAKIARDRGCERIDFQVLDWNTPAIEFYHKLGAVRDDEERHFRFTDEAFKDLTN